MSKLKRLAEELTCQQGEITAEEREHIARTLMRAMRAGEVGKVYLVGPRPDGSIFFEYSQKDDAFVEVQTGLFGRNNRTGISEHSDETRKVISETWVSLDVQQKFEGEPRSEIVQYCYDRCE